MRILVQIRGGAFQSIACTEPTDKLIEVAIWDHDNVGAGDKPPEFDKLERTLAVKEDGIISEEQMTDLYDELVEDAAGDAICIVCRYRQVVEGSDTCGHCLAEESQRTQEREGLIGEPADAITDILVERGEELLADQGVDKGVAKKIAGEIMQKLRGVK